MPIEPAPGNVFPSGGAPLGTAEYLDFLEKEYLASYVALGGSVVKLMIVGNATVGGELTEGLASIGDGFAHVEIDAASTRVHMIDQIFMAIVRQLDWRALTSAVVRDAYRHAGFPAPPPELAVDAVARYHEVDAAELYRSVRRVLEHLILNDVTLSHEFRVAMFRLCSEHLGRGDVSESEREAVLGWLRGERIPAAALRPVGLNARVARHNARPLLVSLTRSLRRANMQGMVLTLDLERLTVGRRPPAGVRDGFYYSKAAVLDAYEVLRQFIDATDELAGLFVGVLLPPELVTDEARGLPAYTALHLRVADEIRDRRRPNPYAALVRLGVRLEAVP